ncbi:CPX chromosomal region candidate gene 1 protein [Saccopteryx bilineata]|uniref:CPX chromosomal region candidate gene 1 protein n=1 Tax=Saccopteryx bilineata TaxID=59482 RepID=UPI003390672C
MSYPIKEENDPVDNAPKVSENEAPSDRNTDREPSFAEPNMTSQVESNPMNRELDIPASQEHAVLQPAENNEPDVEKNQKDPEDLKEEKSCRMQISISQKLIFFMSKLWRMASKNKAKLTDTKRKEKFRIVVIPRLRVSRTQLENIIRKHHFGNDMRIYFRRVTFTLTDDGWKYWCPNCGDTFNTLGEFRRHFCNPLGN